MKPFKGEISQSTTFRKEYKIVTNPDLCEPYYGEGAILYPSYRKGFKNSNKQIFSYQRRMYKTWKYNRKTQWK